MAYLGSYGIVEFQRIPPDPIVIPSASVNVAGNFVTVEYDDWMLAEFVYLIHATGSISGYIYRDSLDRIYLHTSIPGALANTVSSRVSFSGVSTSKPVIIASAPNSSQRSTLSGLLLTLSSVQYERSLRGWPTTNNSYKAQASVIQSIFQGQLSGWEFNRTATEIDTGSVSDKFSSFVKSTVSGSGTFNFFANVMPGSAESDSQFFLKVVQLTEQGSTANLKLYIKTGFDQEACDIGVALFFDVSAIITASSINVSTEDAIRGSASFVTTGPIRLLTE